MNTIEIGLITSIFIALFLLLLFRFEKQRGKRLVEHLRVQFDFVIQNLIHKSHVATQIFLGRILRRSARFLLYSILKGTLVTIKSFERNIANMMRENKSPSQAVKHEDRSSNKLEKIALHKLEVSLTEEEKQKHRENILNG